MRLVLAFVGVVLIWTTTPLGIKWSSVGVSFIFGVTARMSIGLFCLLIMMLLTSYPFTAGQSRTDHLRCRIGTSLCQHAVNLLGRTIYPVRLAFGHFWIKPIHDGVHGRGSA
jgi:drug/metabolite transporter (DMT)-like permease